MSRVLDVTYITCDISYTSAEGQMFIIFLTPQLPFPPDGIRYQEQEQKALIPAGPGRVSHPALIFH